MCVIRFARFHICCVQTAGSGPLVPNQEFSITKQLEPLDPGDLLIIELGALQNYPYYLVLDDVEPIDGSPAPVAFTEVPGGGCPSAQNTCLQLFQFGLSYDVCKLTAAQYRFNFHYAAPGQPDPSPQITLTTGNWCDEIVVNPNAPVITSIEPLELIKGVAVDVIIRGHNFNVGGATPGVKVAHYSWAFAATTWDNNTITWHLSATSLNYYRGLLPLQVVTGHGISNTVSVPVR